MTFHLTCVHIILVRFRLMSGHLFLFVFFFGGGGIAAQSVPHSVDHMFSLYFDYF